MRKKRKIDSGFPPSKLILGLYLNRGSYDWTDSGGKSYKKEGLSGFCYVTLSPEKESGDRAQEFHRLQSPIFHANPVGNIGEPEHF